ncbi:carbonic anhydrase [Choiromyces venosus 120613-1]|uniref:Carbonic anhydrase n=1 Tax=Choiromyces venosus 120613-1 TaxID=1336337 RepID=A0A3N4JEU2_9PEZI|nr:carbonic anhydrase [Choiromyces venosus 120613-1]
MHPLSTTHLLLIFFLTFTHALPNTQSPLLQPETSSSPDNLTTTASTAAPWGYHYHYGPLSWHRLSPANTLCKTGIRQSPINIHNALKRPTGLKLRRGDYREYGILENEGQTVSIKPQEEDARYGYQLFPGDSAGGGAGSGGGWALLDTMHFHTPSEHHLDGEHFVGEIHAVFKTTDGQTTVLSTLLDIDTTISNHLLTTLHPWLPFVATPLTATFVQFDPSPILDRFYRAYRRERVYTYRGSLTTPPCTENVLWMVSQDPEKISVEHYRRLKAITKFNARYPQNHPGYMNLLEWACEK